MLKAELEERARQCGVSLLKGNKAKTVAELTKELFELAPEEDFAQESKDEKHPPEKKKVKRPQDNKTSLEAWKREYREALGGDLTVFKEHQFVPARALTTTNDGILITHGTGTGKTRTAVAAALALLHLAKRDGGQGHVVLLTGKSLLKTFKKELTRIGVTPKEEEWTFMTYAGLTQRRANAKETVQQKLAQFCRNTKGYRTILIIDEAHHNTHIPSAISFEDAMGPRAKSDGIQTRIIVECAKQAWKRLLLTATPLMNNLQELSPLVAAVFGTVPKSASEVQALVDENDDAKIIEWLTQPYCAVSYYHPHGKEREGFPTAIQHIKRITMSESEYETYSQEEEALAKEAEKKRRAKHEAETGPIAKKRSARTVRKEETEEVESAKPKSVNAFYTGLRTLLNTMKIEGEVMKWLLPKIIKEKRKTLIFSHFLGVGVLPISKLLREKGVKFEMINGAVTAKVRDAAVLNFNTNPKVQVFLISGAGGEGLDLKGVRDVILFEPQWTAATEEQAMARAIRFHSHSHLPPKEQQVDVYRVIVEKPPESELTDEYPSIDAYVYSVAQKKQKDVDRYMKLLKKASIEHNPECAK